MQMNGLMGGLYKLSEWIMKLAYVNILWMLFSVLGLLIFGFFPATIAMFVVIRKWLMGDEGIPIFKTFCRAYKKEFMKSNIVGLFIIVLGIILYMNIISLKNTSGILSLAYYPNLVISLGYLLTIFYVFPIFVHYDTTVGAIFKNAFLIMMINPISTIIMMVGSVIVYFLLITMPGLIPIFSGSVISFIVMWAALFAFSKIETKQKKDTLN